MKLFHISQEFNALKSIVENDLEFNEETGEVVDTSETITALFNEIKGELSNKMDNSAYIIAELLGTASILKDEAKRLSERARNFERNSEQLKKLMEFALLSSGEDKIKTDRFTFSFRKSETVEIESIFTPDDFDRRFILIKREFDKVKLKKALQNGEVVEGASIQTNSNFKIK